MILVYHENLVTILTAIVKGGKWSLLEPHSLSIAQLDWTIKQKRQNMGNVCILALNFQSNVRQAITIKVDFLCSKSWYRARRDCKIINNAVETLSSDKKRRSSM